VVAVSGNRRRIRGPALLLALLFFASALAADYREAYRLGLGAIERQDWEEAVRQLDRAIAKRPEASGLLGGSLFRRYTPHFHRGHALVQLGNCRAALPALAEAAQQGRLNREESAQLEQLQQRCRARIAGVEQAVGLAQAEIDRAATRAAAVALIESSPLMAGEWRSGRESFASRQQRALAQLAEARSRLAEAERRLDLDGAIEAGVLAQEASASLTVLQEEAGERRDELRAEVERLLGETRELAVAAQKDLRFVASYLEPFPPALAEIRNRLERDLEQAENAGVGSTPSELVELRDRLQRELRQLRRAVQAPPAELQDAVRAFLAANYQQTLELLGEASSGEPRARAHACLLRAASRHALYRQAPDQGAELLEQARADLVSCTGQAVTIPPHPRVFSPAFLAFYEGEVLARSPSDGPTP
jgi:hypothetical protein